MDLREIYQEAILQHSRKPHNKGGLDNSTADAEGHNAMCGDRVHVWVREVNGRIADASFDGVGCAICVASASMMTDKIKGAAVEDVATTAEDFVALTTGKVPADEAAAERLGKLIVFSGVAQFPMRVKCATLAWRALQHALGHIKKS